VDSLASLAAVVLLVVIAPIVLVAQSLTFRNYAVWTGAVGRLGSVLAGRRSLAGPRHPVAGESVRPGITGIWSVAGSGGAETDTDSLDMYYIQNWSLSGDLEIALLTLRRLGDLFRARR
jgi:hypothetical protein